MVALKRQDGSGILRADIARGKAWGALGMVFLAAQFRTVWANARPFMAPLWAPLTENLCRYQVAFWFWIRMARLLAPSASVAIPRKKTNFVPYKALRPLGWHQRRPSRMNHGKRLASKPSSSWVPID